MFFSCHNYLFAQNTQEYLHFFPESIIQKAKSIKKSLAYTEQEQEVIVLTNLVRMDPKNFILFLDNYIQQTGFCNSNNPYLISLKNTLNKQKANPNALITVMTLKKTALSHAIYAKNTGEIGHQFIENRYNIAQEELDHNTFSENCSYQYSTVIGAFLGLLIDDGIRGLGHRKTILDSRYTHIGVGIAQYQDGSFILVQNFSAK